MVKHIAIGYLIEFADPVEQPIRQLRRPLPGWELCEPRCTSVHENLDSLGAQSAEEGSWGIVPLEDATQQQEDGDDDHRNHKDGNKGAVQLGEGWRVVLVGRSGTLMALEQGTWSACVLS